MIDLILSKNIKNSLWNLLDIFAYPVLFLATTPYFIDRLGEREFGVWMLVNTMTITMQIFNLGLGTATFKHVAANLGVNEQKGINATINTNFSLCLLLHLVCMLAGVCLAIGVRYFSLFKIEPAYINLVSCGALLSGLIVGFKFYEQLINYTFKALERFDIDTMLNTGLKLSLLMVNILLVNLGSGLIGLLIAGIISSLIFMALGFFLLKKQLPGFSFRLRLVKSDIRRELTFAIWPWFQSLAIIITFQCDKFFVVTYTGLATLTYYGLVATMFNHIHMGFNAIVPWLAPKITKLKSSGKETRELYFTARNFSLLIALTALLVFHLVNAPILKLFLSAEKYFYAAGYIRLFTLFELFFVFSIVPHYFLNAAGHERLYFRIVMLYCLSNIAGMLGGFYWYKNAGGIITGMTIATGITMFIQNWIISNRIFNENGLRESLLLFLPVAFIASGILTDILLLKYSLFIVALICLYFVFTKYHKINLNLLKLD